MRYRFGVGLHVMDAGVVMGPERGSRRQRTSSY